MLTRKKKFCENEKHFFCGNKRKRVYINPKDPKILKSFEVAQSIFCVQAPFLAQTHLSLLIIYSQLPPVGSNHPDFPTCCWGPVQAWLWVVIDGRVFVQIHQSSHKLEVGDDTIGADDEKLLVQNSYSAQDRCLCRVGKRQTTNQQRSTLKDKPNFRTLEL